jgi:hypothetical protein
MKALSSKGSTLIKAYAARLEAGEGFRAKELLHLGSRAAVDQALARLARSGEILRISRGLYMLPPKGRYGPRAPSPETVVHALSRATGEHIAPHGAMAANALGLTTQVPVRPIYLTSGRSRRLELGRQTVELRHAPSWQLLLPGEAAGEAVRAISWLGPATAHQSLKTLQSKLRPPELRALAGLRGRLPTWLAREVSGLSYA